MFGPRDMMGKKGLRRGIVWRKNAIEDASKDFFLAAS